MNDLIYLIAERAVKDFNDPIGNVFNAASFGNHFMKIAGSTGILDGLYVRVMLTGRSDIEILGGGYYRLKRNENDR